MGEIADMMLDGTLCIMCGVYIGEGDGVYRFCSEKCKENYGEQPVTEQEAGDE
jgi:predicted nucleic acid-binding Zn ribbon protein